MDPITKFLLEWFDYIDQADISQVNHLDKFSILKIPKDEFLMGGSTTMALFGIRPNKDIDALVTKRVWDKMIDSGKFKSGMANPDRESSKYLYHPRVPDITMFSVDYPLGYSAEEGLKDKSISFEYKSFHFETLKHLIKWKKAMGRPKDLNDVKLIQKFLQK